ncbi:dTDP-4-dehydrorhamnose 3,5-epimerase [Metallibacterium scheffleri]|uniref:dTDP-4-dehydrorhamnose 3,5-epimerase n=1 Tax=Metallibacterium scheffleri TaxID=993689 RepID=A0A4S3KKG0_9GAMM|nr:dTDP-4-dehydrorhamnose 3,5-epimerase [Metallibacterium scheffleri]THD09130.1 dTDP-4-dehydrorhamnose 3,5-epimerase [Metallibacterium scheffleri]
MKRIDTELPGVCILEPDVHGDPRGYFFESFHAAKFAALGLDLQFAQTNVSRSARGVLRGLHYQWPDPQGKLVGVLDGTVWDVAVDIRRGSPSFGRWTAVELSSDNHRLFWIPQGYAHGFCVLSAHATFMYQCTALYVAAADAGVRWDDDDIGITWPLATPILSAKDSIAPRLREIDPARLPVYVP